ncbi:hypothetical protein Glove_132g229 [Diversispora epigaea]|uniref:Uncharacterized protein n=1 Tax=Diversispora epigaea TaxID=1348612 RepID=A0A397J7P8_9GLOM|nr:hypothetical protein Glove_132g229 [Diversispora epigaea]
MTINILIEILVLDIVSTLIRSSLRGMKYGHSQWQTEFGTCYRSQGTIIDEELMNQGKQYDKFHYAWESILGFGWLVSSVYEATTSYAVKQSKLTEAFNPEIGIEQGDALCSLLCIGLRSMKTAKIKKNEIALIEDTKNRKQMETILQQ